jgi:heme-degrading monooxygenase HmoA
MEDRFADIYGSAGDWAQLFRTADGFLRTELVADLKDARRYLTLDFWRSREAYDRFRAENSDRYSAIDAQCEELTESEIEVGQFERR